MEIGIGLPAAVPGAPGRLIADWARRAEQRGFSALGVIDRVVYDNYEPIIALSAAAAVTERIGLTTSILLAPCAPTRRCSPSSCQSRCALGGAPGRRHRRRAPRG